MASPCCPKCGKTHFAQSRNNELKVTLIYCTSCGAVAGTAPLTKLKVINTGSKGKTASDDWDAMA